jgi:glycogen phosphorylase
MRSVVSDRLLIDGDHHMHLANLKSYFAAAQRLCELYADGDGSARKAILHVAGPGEFTAEYASEISEGKTLSGGLRRNRQ